MIALFYGHFASNLGDVAITHGVYNLLRTAGKPFRFVCPPLSKVGEASRLAFEDAIGAPVELVYADAELEGALKGRELDPSASLSYFDDLVINPLAILERNGVADCDTFVFIGGEHLFSNGRAKETHAVAGRLLPLLAAIALKRKVVILPSTFGPFHDPLASILIRTVLKGAHAAAMRETASAEHLDILGMPPGAIPSLLDPAFFLTPPQQSAPPKAGLINFIVRLDQYGMRVGGPESSQTLRTMRELQFSNSDSIVFHTDLIKQTLKREPGASVQILVQTDADQEVANVLAKSIGEDNRVTVNRPGTISDFMQALAAGQCTVSSRFHGIIFSMLAKRPALGVYYQEHGHKIPGLMSLFDVQSNCVEGIPSNSDIAMSRLVEMLRDQKQQSIHLEGKLSSLKSETQRWLDEVLG